MSEMDHFRILFLSYESSHNEIFLKVINELRKGSNVWFKILDSDKLFFRPLSVRFSYKKEISYFEQIIDQMKPDIFVVANDQGISATFIRICKLRGIPSVAIQDGILINKRLNGFSAFLAWRRYFPWRIISNITNIRVISMLSILFGRQWCVPEWGTGNATFIAAMGNYYKHVLVSRGISPDKIVVTGYPLLDDFQDSCLDTERFKNIKEKFVKGNQSVILLITQPLVEDNLWKPSLRVLHFESIINAVKHVNGQLIVKVHPRENIGVYKLLASKYSDIHITVVKDFNVNQLILLSDVVIAVSSTVGLWVMAYHKPLIVASYFPTGNVENILQNLATSIDKREDLAANLYDILKNDSVKNKLLEKQSYFLQEHLHYLDGCAIARVANLIISVAKNNIKPLA